MAIAQSVLENQQGELMEYCKSDKNPLDYRWELWKDYVDKKHLKYLPNLTVIDIRSILEDIKKKNQTVSYEELIEHCDEVSEAFPKVKEELINKNIGSFEYTW